jgi:chromosome segregation ATPase
MGHESLVIAGIASIVGVIGLIAGLLISSGRKNKIISSLHAAVDKGVEAYSDLEKILDTTKQVLVGKEKVISGANLTITENEKVIENLEAKVEKLTETIDKHTKGNLTEAKLKEQLDAANAELEKSKKEIQALREDNKKSKAPAKKSEKKDKSNQKKLDCPKIKSARARIAKGEILADIAVEYNVDSSTLKRALDGVTYKDCVEAEVSPSIPTPTENVKVVERKPSEKKTPTTRGEKKTPPARRERKGKK